MTNFLTFAAMKSALIHSDMAFYLKAPEKVHGEAYPTSVKGAFHTGVMQENIKKLNV
ncbi:MAG: hypothetical protein ACFB0A_15540 [Croceivirga sp.]